MPTIKYVAGRRLRVGDGYKEYGEPVPEAASWKNLEAHLSSGAIKAVVVDEPTVSAAPPPVSVEPTMSSADTGEDSEVEDEMVVEPSEDQNAADEPVVVEAVFEGDAAEEESQ